tara:strand:+ start:161 stop:421 length:261 start_codon:yes stop_codon:yes gene_type:complete
MKGLKNNMTIETTVRNTLDIHLTNKQKEAKIIELFIKKKFNNEQLNYIEELIIKSPVKLVDKTADKEHQKHVDDIEEKRIKEINSL